MGKLLISEQEALEYSQLPRNLVASKYITRHRSERCPYCNRLIGTHSIKRMRNCIELDIAHHKIEQSALIQFVDQQPRIITDV